MDNKSYTYRFDLDRDFIDISMRFQSTLPFVTLLVFRPLIFFILLKKRDYMGADIRRGYLINQVTMIAQEFNFCFLFRIHDLAPYSGLYCDGPICRMGIDKQYLMLILATTTIGTVPTFLLLLVRMHQRIIENTNSRLKLSKRAQAVIIFALTAVLITNVFGFYAYGRDCSNAGEMEKIPDLAWLKERGGTLFLFGPPGQPEFFGKELWWLFCSILIIAPFVAVATIHSVRMMREQKLIGVYFFYILPLSCMLVHMAIDVSIFPPWLISLGRCVLIIPFTLESTQLSLIFLLKNPVHREIIKSAFCRFRGEVRPNDTTMNYQK